MSSRKSKDKDRSDRKGRGDSTKTLIEVAPSAIVDQPLSRSVSNQQKVLRRGESDDYYNPRPDTLPGPGYVESPTHYNGGPPPNQPSYGGASPPAQTSYNGAAGPNQVYDGGPPGPQHNRHGSGHEGYTGGGPIYHAGYDEPAPAHYSQHAGARPPMKQGASADYYHGSGSYSNSGPPPMQQSGSYGGGGGSQGQGLPGAFPPNLQHTQSAPQYGYPATGYQHPIPTQGQKPPRRDSSSSSSSSSYVDISRNYPLPPVRKTPLGAIRTFFTAPSESRRRVIRRKSSRTLREQRRQGRLAQGRTRSASSSEADSDLAYGSGYLRRRKRRGSRGSRSPGGRRYQHSRSPRRNGYGSPGRRGGVGRDKMDGRRENYHPSTAGGVPLPGLSHANTMPGGFPIETLATAGAAGAIAAGLSRKDSKKGKKDAEKEILKLGEDLHNLAKRQNKYDLEEAAKRGRFNVVRHNQGRHGLGPKGFGGEETTRGIPSSKPQRPKEDDGWETSDSDDSSSSSESADSAMAFGGENTYQGWKWREPNHPPRSARRDSHQGQNEGRERDQHYPHPPTRKSTIVDPKLFGPQNSLQGVVERPVGFGSIDDLRGDGATPLDPPTVKQTGYFRSPLPSPKPAQRDKEDIKRMKENERKRREEPILLRDGSSRQGSTREMQHVFPMPTEDPGFVDFARATPDKRPSFHARTDSLPLRQPKPMSPVRREVYDSREVSVKKGKGKGKEKESSTRSNDLALGALAGGAIATAVAAGMASPEVGGKFGKGKSKVIEDEQDREIDSQRMFKDDMARRNGRRPETRPYRKDSYGLPGLISAVSPTTTRDGKVDPFQFQVNDDAWESNGDKKGKKPMPAHERMAARAAGSFRDSGSSTPRKYVEDVARDKEREREYQEQLYSSSPEMLRLGDSDFKRPLERTDSGRIVEREIEPLHESLASRAAESGQDTDRPFPRASGLPSSSASALDAEAERRIREVVQKWGILGRKSTGFADVVLAARKAELEKVEPVYTPPAPEIKMVERAPKWASARDIEGEGRVDSPRWHRGDGPESPVLSGVKAEDVPPVVRRGSSDADHRYASMHDDYFSSKERPREGRRGRSRTRSPSPPMRGRSRTRSRSVVRGRSPSLEVREARSPLDRRPHNTEHELEDIDKVADKFTAPIPYQDIEAAIVAVEAEEHRHPHDPHHEGHDPIQEKADKYWREMELARKLAKQHDNDPTPRVVTPPAMDHHSRDRDEEEKRKDKGPYAEPDADFRFDHEMHPHELPLFTPVALRKSFSLPKDFDEKAPFDPKLLGLDRPLLNIVRPTPTPEKQAKAPVLKEPRSRSQSRERQSETSRFVPQDEDRPTYGKPVEIEEISDDGRTDGVTTSRGIDDVPAINEPEADQEKSVSWGENDTQVYVPITPYDEARNPHDAPGSIPSSPETTRAAPGGGLPHSHSHDLHKQEESENEDRKKDKGKAKADTPEKRPKPKSLWSRFTPDLAKRIQEREELAYNLANASTIGFADGDEGREVPRDEVAELALERGRRFNDPTHEDYGKKSVDPELETGEAFEYKGVVVEPEAPRKSKKKHRKHSDRTPSPPAVGPKPTSPSGRMPGSFDSDTEVAFARPRGVSPPASDVSTVIYHNPLASELSDSMAGIATGFNSEIGIRPRGIDAEESFVDVQKPASSNESFEVVEKQPEETMVVTVEPAGEQPESFAVVGSHSSIPSEETQPLIVDAPTPADGPLDDREVLETPLTETEGFVTPLAEVVTPFDATAGEDIPAPQIVDAAAAPSFLGGTRSISPLTSTEQQEVESVIDAILPATSEVVDTSAPKQESASTETEASLSSKSKKKKKKGKKSATAEPEIIADTSVLETLAIEKKLVEAVPVAEDSTFPSEKEIIEQAPTEDNNKEIIVDLTTPIQDKNIQGENTSTISPPLNASAEVVASEITEPSRQLTPTIPTDTNDRHDERTDHDSITKLESDGVPETSGTREIGGTSSGVAPLDLIAAEDVVKETSRDVELEEKKKDDGDKKKKSLFDSDFAAVALAGTAAAVAGIANAVIPSTSSTKSEEQKAIEKTKEEGGTDVPVTKEFLGALAESWVAPEMPSGMNKKAKKAWTQKVAKEREAFESAQASMEVRGEHWSASVEQKPQAEFADTSAPVVERSSKDTVDAPLAVTSGDAERSINIVEPAPEPITTTGEAASYYNPTPDASAPSAEPLAEASKDINDSSTDTPATEDVVQPAPALWEQPEMPAGLNKKAKKAWTQKVAKEKEEWETAQASKRAADEAKPVTVDAPTGIAEESKEVVEPQPEVGDAEAVVIEESYKDVLDAPAEPMVEVIEKPIEIAEAIPEPVDASSTSTDIPEETSKDITSKPTESVVEAVDAPAAVIELIPELWQEPEMPTGLNKKQKTAWKKKIAKEKEAFESARASRVASAEASKGGSGSQTPAVQEAPLEVVEEKSKDIVDAPVPVVEESNKEVVDAPALTIEESSKEIVDAPIEVVEAAPVNVDAPAMSTDIVEDIAKDIVDAPIDPAPETIDASAQVVDVPAPSTDIIEESTKDITSTPSSLTAGVISAPAIAVYEEPIMPTGLNKKQKQAWKKKVAKEKEEWESARSSAEGSAKESGLVTATVVEEPASVVEEATEEVMEEPAVVVTETVGQSIIEATQALATEHMPSTQESVQEEPATILVDAPPPAPEARVENFDDAVRAIHDATSESAAESALVEETSKGIVEQSLEPATASVPVAETIETRAESSIHASATDAEPPKKMNKRERKAWDKAQREAAAAKALADEEAAAAASAPFETLATPQFEVPEVLPTPVFEDESGAFATAPPETPLATPLETPQQVEQASDSPAEGEDVVSLSMEDAATLAASAPETLAGDVSLSIEDAPALPTLAGDGDEPRRMLSKKEKNAAEKAARDRELEVESSTATEGEVVSVPVEEFKDLVDVPAADEAVAPLEAPLETSIEETEVSIGGKKKKKKGKGKAADVADMPVGTPLETTATEVVAPAVEHNLVAETLALLGGISHSRALPVQQSIEPVSVEQTLESPTDDDDAFHSAAEDRARSATPTGTVDDDDFHSTNEDGAWHSPRINGHDQPGVVPEMGKVPGATETEVTEDDAFAPAKGKKKKKKKGKGPASSSPSNEDSMTEGDAKESFLANAGTLGAGVGSAAAGPRDMNSGLESEERNADAAGRWESQPRSIGELVEGDKVGEAKGEGTVVGHDEGGDVLTGQTLKRGRKQDEAIAGVDPVEETRRVLEGIEHSNAKVKERRVVSDPLLNDPEVTGREIMPGIDPQFGDLLPLPPRDSPPNEEVNAGALVTVLPPTPADVPAGFQPLGGIQEQAEPSESKEEILTIDPEIHPRSIRPAIDPQFGDLLELPPSQPGSPARPVDDDAVSMHLPDSPPESPAVARTSLDGVRESPQTPRKKDTTHSMRSPSINAVPLKFLLGGRASGSTPSSPVAGSATSPTRPKSRHSWDSSKGLQPLTLLSGMERRHSRGSSLAEFESRSLAPLLEAASKDNMSTADTVINTAGDEQAGMTGTDGEGTDVFATAVSEKRGEEYFPKSVPAPVEASSADIADSVLPAPSTEVVEQGTKEITGAPIEPAPEIWHEPEMPTGLNKKQKTTWKKKVAKERHEWESAKSSAEQSEGQMPTASNIPVEIVEPIAEETNKEAVDAPVEVVEPLPEILDAPAPSTDAIDENSKDIADATTQPIAETSETQAQPAIEEALHTPAVEAYEEPEMSAGLNKKQKQAWKKKIAKEKEEWESARSAQGSNEQISGAWTKSGDQKAAEDAAAPQVEVPVVGESQDTSKLVEVEAPVEAVTEPASDIAVPPTILAEPAVDNVDLENVLQQVRAVVPSLPSDDPLPEASKDITNALSPEQTAQLPTALVYEAPEMPTGMNKKQKKTWQKKIAKEKEEWESSQSSADQTGDQTSAAIDAPVKIVDAPAESIAPIIEAPVEVMEVVPETIDAPLLSEPIVEQSSKDIVDVPIQPTIDIVNAPVIKDSVQPQTEVYQEPEMPSGLNKKQKTAWKKKVAKEKEEWESAQSSASATDAPAVQDASVVLVEESAKKTSEPTPMTTDAPIPTVTEASKEIFDTPAGFTPPIIEAPPEAIEAVSEIIEPTAPSADIVDESSKDLVGTPVETTATIVPEVISTEATQPEPEAYREPEMPSGLNKKQKTAWKKKIAKQREEFESAQASASASGAQTPAMDEVSKDISDAPIEAAIEVVDAQRAQETPKLEIGGFIETPVAEIVEPVLIEAPADIATQEQTPASIENSTKDMVDTPVEVVSEPASDLPAVDESQPAKKLNAKQRKALARKLKEEAGSASASTSGGWTDSGDQTPAGEPSSQPIIEEGPAQTINEPVEAVQERTSASEEPSSGSITDFDAAVRALHDKSGEPAKPTIEQTDVMSYLETPAESEAAIPVMAPVPETPLEISSEPVFDKEAKETSKDIIDAPATELTPVFVTPEMPASLNKKQKKAWEKKVQKEREEWESAQASKEASGSQTPAADKGKSASEPSATGFSTDAPVEEQEKKTEPIDPTIYDVSDTAERPNMQPTKAIAIPASEPQISATVDDVPAVALPVYEGGGEAASYFEGKPMRTPPRAASPELKKSLFSEAQIADDEQVSESAGEKGDVDSSAFETSSEKSKKKKKKGKEVAIEAAIVEVQSPALEKERDLWPDDVDDYAAPKAIAPPTMLPAIVKGAFSRPPSPELKVSDTPSGKKSKTKKKGKKGTLEEIETPPAVEPSLETVAISTEPAPEPPFEGTIDKTLPDVATELETAKEIEPAPAVQPLESDANDSPPTPDAVRGTLALLGGISHTLEPVIKTSAQPDIPAEVADETVAIEQPAIVKEYEPAQIDESGPKNDVIDQPAPAPIEMPVMPKGFNKKQKKAWEKKNAALIAEAEASQAASAAASGNQTPAPVTPLVEEIQIPDVPETLREFVAEPSPIVERKPILDDTPLPEVPIEVAQEEAIEPEVANEIPLPETTFGTPFESAFESDSSKKKKKKKGKMAAAVETGTESDPTATTLPDDVPNVLESGPTSDTAKDVEIIDAPLAIIEDAINEASAIEALPEIPEESAAMIDDLEPSIARNVPLPQTSGDATPAQVSTEAEQTSAWEEPEMPKGLNKKKKAEWKKKMAKEKEEWESAQASAIQTPAEVVEDIPSNETVVATVEKELEEPAKVAENVEDIAQQPPVTVDDTPADAPTANIPEESAAITDDFELSIARNVALPDSEMATPIDSPAESAFESASSKKSKKKKGKKGAIVVEEEPSSPASEIVEEMPKEVDVVDAPAIEVVDEPREAIIKSIPEPSTSVGKAAEYYAEASKDIAEPPPVPAIETISATAVEEVIQPMEQVWEEPIMPTGLNKKKRDAWKKKVAKEKEEWEAAQASKSASADDSGWVTHAAQETIAEVVESKDVDMQEALTAAETSLEEPTPTPSVVENIQIEALKEPVIEDAPADHAVVVEDIAKEMPVPETPLEIATESSAFDSVSSSKSKKKKKGKKGGVIIEEEPVSPPPEVIGQALNEPVEVIDASTDKTVDIPSEEHVTISEPILHDAVVEVDHPSTPPTTEHLDVSVGTHEERPTEPISANDSGAATPFVSVSINEASASASASDRTPSHRTPDPEKTEGPIENTEAPKTAFLEHSASGNGSSLPREMQEEMEQEQQVVVSGAGAEGVRSYGDETKEEIEADKIGEASAVVDETVEREMPKGLNKKQKKAWEKAEKKRIEEALAAADAKALEEAAKVEAEEISREVIDEPVVESAETPVLEEVEDEWRPTRKLSKKEQKAADRKRREEEEQAEIEAEAGREQEQLAAIEEQVEAPILRGEVDESTHEVAPDPEAPVENIETRLETSADDEWSVPARKLSKKEQKAADKKRRKEEEQAEPGATLKREQELADVKAKTQQSVTPIIEEEAHENADEPSLKNSETPIETLEEEEWAPKWKLSKKEKKALDKKRRDADEQALIDAAAIATVALVTGDDRPTSSSPDVENPMLEKQVEVATPIEESSKLDSGNESPPANTKVKRKDKGKGKAIDIVDAPSSAGPTKLNESQDRSISMATEPPQVMNIRTASPDRGIFQQALEKVVKKQVQQRDLQAKVQENITAQAVKGSWSFSALDDEKEENTPWSASRLPPVLEEDVMLEQPRTPDDATRSRSPIYRGLDKEDSAYVGGAESPKPRPRSWFDPEYVRDSGVLLREKKSSDSQKSFSERANADEALVRRSWPPVEDEKQTVDLRRKKGSSLKESQFPLYEKITPKDIAKAATGLGIVGGHKRSLSKSPALSESPSREFLLRKANRSQTPSSDEKHSSTLSRQPSALRDVGRSETPRSASDRQHQRQSSLLESLHNDSPRSFSDNIHNPRTRTPSGISREEYYNRGLPLTPTSERGASGLGSVLSRPGSVISNRSVTPSLRRVSGRASTDLRALSQSSQLELATTKDAQPRDDSGSASDNNKPNHQGDKDKSINTSDVSAATDTRAPAPNEGKKRVKGMTEVYNGFGEGRMGSPRSPTRPHSMRRKQSMQLLDMQAQMAAMAEELAAARQEKAVILQAKEAAERNLDEARREAGKTQQYKAQAEEVRGLLESMTLKNTDLTRQTLDLQAQLEERDNSAQATIAATVAAAIADKEQELVQLRQRAERLSHDWSGDEREIEELEAIIVNQKLEIASLKQSHPAAVNGPDYLAEYARDDAYFEQSCQKLFRGVWRWIHAFSDRRKHSLSSLEDIKCLEDPRIYQWMKDAFTSNPSSYLADLDKRRLILMALTMSLFHHYIFSKHFFGLTKDQEDASRVLEMVVDDSDISDGQFRLWRATQFCLFSKSRNYSTQRNQEVFSVTNAVMRKLSDVLPQPSSSASDDQRTRILIEELKIIVKKAAELSNDMRRQSTKYSWRQSERAVWGEKRTRTPERFEAGKMTHAEICVQFMELHRVDEKLSNPGLTADVRAGLERERSQHIQSLIQDFHVVSESEVVSGWRLSWDEMVRRMEEKNRRIEEKGMGVRLSLFPMVVKEDEDQGKVVIWKSVVKPVDLKSGIPSASGKRRIGGESSVGGSEHGSKHPRMR